MLHWPVGHSGRSRTSNNECAVAKKLSRRYGVTFLSLSFVSLYDPLGPDRAWVLGLKCERLGLNLYTGRREGDMCVMIPEVPKRTYTRLHFVRKQHHFKDPTDDVDASKVGAVRREGTHYFT